ESGVALKELQATIQSCLTALEMSSINVQAWDCLLVFMISSKLPKVTLSMWEQSVHNKAEIPTWKELDNFLTERHRTLEAIDDVRPSGSMQFPPRSGLPTAPARRLNSYETRLHQQYLQSIEEYFDLQQIQEVTTSEDSHSHINTNGKLGVFCITIPHHAVLKEDSLTTKLRVIYDASCKSSNGKTLNDILCTGPALQNDLEGVILNWRCYRYVFVADIQRMYRCIEMHPEDSQFQRIWWRDKTGELKEFRLTTVTFGTASTGTAFTAIRVIHQIAQDERENYPLAEKVLKRETYVDDVQSGHETTDGAIRVRNEVIA
ncbi:hypothetical protein KR074_004723, partial [Drosophila pseudoananassae]